MRYRPTFIASLLELALLVSLLVSSCGSSTSSLDQTQTPSLDSRILPPGSPLPSLPADNGTSGLAGGSHSTSAVTQYVGSGFIQASGATIDGDSVVLQSEPGGMAWALYQVPDLTGFYVDRFGVQTLPQGPGHPYTVGVSNYTDNRWEYLITGTLPEVEIDLTENTKQLISTLGNVYYIVIVSGGDSVRMNLAWLNIMGEGGFGTPATPTDTYASAGAEGQIYLYWAYPEGADFCEVWRTDDATDWAQIATATTGFYIDTTVQDGTRYEYKVRAVNDIGHSAFSNSSEVWTYTDPNRIGFIDSIDATTVTVEGRTYNHDAATEWWDNLGNKLTWADFHVGQAIGVDGTILETGFYATYIQSLEEGE